jgi:probable HAF family extracellular repeat protein
MHQHPAKVGDRSSHTRLFTATVCLCAAAIVAPHAPAAPTYTILDLGAFHPGGESFATDINNFGQVVGNAIVPNLDPNIPSPFIPRAFRTRPNQPLNRDTDDLGSFGGASQAEAINDQGQVVGSSAAATGPFRAFRTAPNAPINPATDALGSLDGSGGGTARGINRLGQVVGDSAAHGFRTAPNLPINPATDHLAPSIRGGADDINDLGQVLFNAETQINPTDPTDFRSPAYRTQPNQPVNPATDDLGTLGGRSTRARAINNAGYVVGESADAQNAQRAFVVGPTGQIHPVTSLIPTPLSAVAHDINRENSVVGEMSLGPLLTHAFLYDYEDRQLIDLNARIDPALGWTLFTATAINDLGQIVGAGQSPGGNVHAFVLTPIVPEPAGLLAVATLCALARRRRTPALP